MVPKMGTRSPSPGGAGRLGLGLLGGEVKMGYMGEGFRVFGV